MKKSESINSNDTNNVAFSITIAVDTQFVSGLPQGIINAGQGVYMFDNNINGGSTSEGSTELNSTVSSDQLVSFNVIAINQIATNDTLSIAGFEVSQGTTIFPNKPSLSGTFPDYQWIGKAVRDGSMTYQLKIELNGQFYFWDPFMTCQN